MIPHTAVGDLPNFPKWLPKVPESLVQEQKGVRMEQAQVLLLQCVLCSLQVLVHLIGLKTQIKLLRITKADLDKAQQKNSKKRQLQDVDAGPQDGRGGRRGGRGGRSGGRGGRGRAGTENATPGRRGGRGGGGGRRGRGRGRGRGRSGKCQPEPALDKKTSKAQKKARTATNQKCRAAASKAAEQSMTPEKSKTSRNGRLMTQTAKK